MSEKLDGSPVYLSAQELMKFSIFPKEAVHFQNVDMRSAQAVLTALRTAGIQSQQRTRTMQDMYDAGYVQDWEMARQKIKQDFS